MTGARKRKGTIDATMALDAVNKVPSTVRALVGPERLVLTLPDFVAKYAPSLPPLILESCTLGERMRRTFVCPEKTLKPIPEIRTAKRSQSLVDLVDDVIWTLVQRKSRDWSQRNVLDQGYSVSSGDKEHMRPCPNMRPGVICTQIDDNVNFCKTSPYAEALYRMIGDALMRVLLLQTTVFLPVEGSGGNFILLCGTARSTSARQTIGKKHQTPEGREETSAWKANNLIPRQSLFYSQAYAPKIGFQPGHVMNQGDPKQLLNAIVSLYTSKGKKRRKRWIRCRDDAIPLCKEIIRRHERFDYHRTLNRLCPLPDFALLGTKIKADVSEAGTAHTPAKSVILFLKEVIHKVFPIEFWGSPHNFDQVISKVSTFVTLRRFERLPNKALTEGLRVTDIRWMWTADKSKSSHMAATTLLREAMRWTICGFTIPLLRSIFYVTESEFSGNRVLYYRKPVWSIFRTLSISKLTAKQYNEVNMQQAAALLEPQRMGLSRLKLLPKATGVRPIAMLSKRDTLIGNAREHNGRHPSTNTTLANTFQVLRYEYERKPETFGAGQAGLNGVFPIFKSFLSKVRCKQKPWSKKTKKQLYFVSVDIQKCYDNVNQARLHQIINDIVHDDQYLIQRHSVLHPFHSLGRPVWKTVRMVGGLQEHEMFHALSARLSPQYTDSVFSNGIGSVITNKQDIMSLLKEHLQSNLVAMPGRYGKRFFLQTSGIPQGSVLSSFLCNFYYAKMETEILGSLLEDASECTLIRLTDDFIFITTDRNQAETFLEKMKRGKPELGVTINTEKSLSNLDLDCGVSQLLTMSGRTLFPWCGLLIDTSTGEVRIDYSRFANAKALDSLTIDRCQVGRNLEIRMKTFVRPRCQPILYDSTVNSFEVVVCNFTQMMLLAALKSQEIIRSVIDVDKNVGFIRNAIESTIAFARNLIIHRLKQHSSDCSFLWIGHQDALCLGRGAFQTIFERLGPDGVLPARNMLERRTRLDYISQLATREFIAVALNQS
jgi:telomerase reverse transcriptase